MSGPTDSPRTTKLTLCPVFSSSLCPFDLVILRMFMMTAPVLEGSRALTMSPSFDVGQILELLQYKNLSS